MRHFYVHDRNLEDSTLALRDASGGFYLARATSDLPALGSKLEGSQPSLGFSTLRGVSTGRIYRVIFESVETDHRATMDRPNA